MNTNQSMLGFVGIIGIAVAWDSYRRFKKQHLKNEQEPSLHHDQTNSHVHSSLEECIYCDYNATTPVYPEVYQAIVPYLTNCYGNPSSGHVYGEFAKQAVVQARQQVVDLIGATAPEEIFFLSCGSEADNRCIDIAIHNFRLNHIKEEEKSILPHFITSSIEHIAILCYLRIAQVQKKLDLTIIPVDSQGFVDVDALEKALTKNTAMVTIMHSSNEIGTIQPIRAISKIIRRFNKANNTNVLFHSDAAQSIGKVCVDVRQLDVDMLTVVGHKFGAPKGVAALYVRKCEYIKLYMMMIGGGQEHGYRAGTENVAYSVALGEASRLAKLSVSEYILRCLTLKLQLLKRLHALLGDKMQFVKFNGPVRSNTISTLEEDLRMLRVILKDPGNSNNTTNNNTPSAKKREVSELLDQLPNTISVSFKHLIGHDLVHELAKKVACSTGSACHALPSGKEEATYTPSEVLVAIGLSNDFGVGTLRLSLGRFSNEQEVNTIADTVGELVLRKWKNVNLV